MPWLTRDRWWLVLGLVGMRILLANAVDADKFKTGLLREATGMPDLFALAAKKLLNNAEYEASGIEHAWVLTNNFTRAAEVDEVDDVQENDSVVVAFDGAEFQHTSQAAAAASGL